MINKKSGFTLIELLVVIAIIGILSSIVLVSLNAARGRAQDAKSKAQLSSARDAAQLFFDSNNGYNGSAGDITNDCTTADSMFTDTASGMASYTDLNNYPNIGVTTMRCSSNTSEYAISVSLQDPTEFWCIDSNSVSKLVVEPGADHAVAHPDDDTTCN